MMAEELRHGYQMMYLLIDDEGWADVSGESGEEVFEEILSMRTGSHVLGAFNVEFDSFVDNIVFCALIDRVGKYQLSMQKVSAYRPMSESMPPMLREEAFHLATGVLPLRRWMAEAARGGQAIPIDAIQRTINKWIPRGLEMFGDERGGHTNVRLGFKPMPNEQAQGEYYEEVQKLVLDLDVRYMRERFPDLPQEQIEKVLSRVLEEGETYEGVGRENLLRCPDRRFFRRRGVPAFEMIGHSGEVFTDLEEYTRHLAAHLPQSSLAGRDFSEYLERLGKVVNGEVTREEAARRAPVLRRVGGGCPCSRAVRWVKDEPEVDEKAS